MIQAITYMTYCFSVANTGQREPFRQSWICSKTMQQISLKGHRLVMVMVFMESMVLNPFIKYSGYAKNILLNATSHHTSAGYAKKNIVD